MRKILVIVFCLVLGLGLHPFAVCGQNIEFQKVYEGSRIKSLSRSFDNSYLVNAVSGQILKIDSIGNTMWYKYYDNDITDSDRTLECNNIIPTYDSCFVAVGWIYDNLTANVYAFCMKINSQGDTLWSKKLSIDGCSLLNANSVCTTSDSGFVLTGIATADVEPNDRIFAAKLDLNGNLQWLNLYSEQNSHYTSYSIKQAQDSGYFLSGYMESYDSLYDQNAFIIKISNLGNLIWANKYNYPIGNNSVASDMDVLGNGILCYIKMASGFAFMKTDFLGNILWGKYYYSTGMNIGNSKLNKTSDNCYVFVNGKESPGFYGEITKIDTSGNVLWAKESGLLLVDILATKDNGLLIAGNDQYTYNRFGLLKTDSTGNIEQCLELSTINSTTVSFIHNVANIITTNGGVINNLNLVITDTVISSMDECMHIGINESNLINTITIYPNPATTEITITGYAPTYLKLCNTLGQTVAEASKSNKLYVGNLPQGLYVLQVFDEKGEVVKMEKVIVGK